MSVNQLKVPKSVMGNDILSRQCGRDQRLARIDGQSYDENKCLGAVATGSFPATGVTTGEQTKLGAPEMRTIPQSLGENELGQGKPRMT